MLAVAPTLASAQVRTWTGSEGTTTFRAELFNAYDDNAYFQKEGDGFVRVPIKLLATYDIARVMDWSAKRDEIKDEVLMANNGLVSADIRKQWPSRIVDGALKDADANNIPTPRMFVFMMIKKETMSFSNSVEAIAKVEDELNAACPNFMQVVVITPKKEAELKQILYTLGSKGNDGWLMPNEWAYKDNKEIWNGYWRAPDFNILILDPAGTVLCDGSTKEADGSPSDPVAFLNSMIPAAKRIGAGGASVPNPLVNNAALSDVIEGLKAKPEGNHQPIPALFDPSLGMEPEVLEGLMGSSLQVQMVICADGKVKDVKVIAGAGSVEEDALRRASRLWQFIPVIKDGQAEEKTVVVPIRFKAPKAE